MSEAGDNPYGGKRIATEELGAFPVDDVLDGYFDRVAQDPDIRVAKALSSAMSSVLQSEGTYMQWVSSQQLNDVRSRLVNGLFRGLAFQRDFSLEVAYLKLKIVISDQPSASKNILARGAVLEEMKTTDSAGIDEEEAVSKVLEMYFASKKA